MATILIIDDDPSVCETIVNMLSAAGHDAHATTDSKNCENLIDRLRPDLVILDILMPDRDGIEVLQALHTFYPSLRVVAMSGGGRTHDTFLLPLAEKLGAAASLGKPFSASALCEVVEMGPGPHAACD